MATLAVSTAAQTPRHFVVLGGGISGLTTAYGLLKYATGSPPRVTLLEASHRVGGWIRSERVKHPLADTVTNAPKLLREAGPRTLRPTGPAGLATLYMIHELGLGDEILTVSRTSAAARNRYIYAQDKLHLLRPLSILGSSFVRPAILSALLEPFRGKNTPSSDDESLYDFISRRFSTTLADRILSAVVGGIYAGDIHELSARACLNRMWRLEREHGSIIRGLQRGLSSVSELERTEQAEADEQRKQLLASTVPAPVREAVGAAIYSFQHGLQRLTDTLQTRLEQDWPQQFNLLLNHKVQHIQMNDTENGIMIQVDNGTCIQADHVISTLPSQQTLSLLSPTAALPSLARVAPTSANVAVVNLTYYGRLKMPNGFGYLIPSTVPDTKALGVVFDSDALPGQDQGQNVTRMTVMLGGRSRWNHTFDTMSREDFIDEALNAVQKHLGIPDMPLDVQAHIHRSCIPQYGVGHVTALQQLHRELSQVYRGRLSLTGASYLGVSVNDCVWRALQLAKRLTTSTTEVVTGLEAADVL